MVIWGHCSYARWYDGPFVPTREVHKRNVCTVLHHQLSGHVQVRPVIFGPSYIRSVLICLSVVYVFIYAHVLSQLHKRPRWGPTSWHVIPVEMTNKPVSKALASPSCWHGHGDWQDRWSSWLRLWHGLDKAVDYGHSSSFLFLTVHQETLLSLTWPCQCH